MTDYKQHCIKLLQILDTNWPLGLPTTWAKWADAVRADLAEPEPQRRYLYNPVQIAECGGPCQQGPEHCDCGELWVTEPGPRGSDGLGINSTTDQLMTQPLSPAAQAVLNAVLPVYDDEHLYISPVEKHAGMIAAATIKAVADRVVPVPIKTQTPDEHWALLGVKNRLLSIADELESQ